MFSSSFLSRSLNHDDSYNGVDTRSLMEMVVQASTIVEVQCTINCRFRRHFWCQRSLSMVFSCSSKDNWWFCHSCALGNAATIVLTSSCTSYNKIIITLRTLAHFPPWWSTIWARSSSNQRQSLLCWRKSDLLTIRPTQEKRHLPLSLQNPINTSLINQGKYNPNRALSCEILESDVAYQARFSFKMDCSHIILHQQKKGRGGGGSSVVELQT